METGLHGTHVYRVGVVWSWGLCLPRVPLQRHPPPPPSLVSRRQWLEARCACSLQKSHLEAGHTLHGGAESLGSSASSPVLCWVLVHGAA